MSSLLNKEVFTPLGRGKVAAVFEDGTLCVALRSGGGVVLREDEIFPRDDLQNIEWETDKKTKYTGRIEIPISAGYTPSRIGVLSACG